MRILRTGLIALLAGCTLVTGSVSAQIPAQTAPAESAVLTATQASASAPASLALVAAAAVSAPAPLKAPGLVPASTLNGADTAWLMVSTALVLLMTLPGIALFYGGMIRKKNVINTMAGVVVTAAVVSLLWFCIGYSWAFTPGSAWLGGSDRAWFSGFDLIKSTSQVAVSHIAPNVPESVYALFQLSFAIITTALIVGAVVERMRFSAVIWFAALWSVFVYAPVAHWVWEPGGWLAQKGVLDFAGGAVVHINAGTAALVAAYFLRPRSGFGREPLPPFNLGLTMAGAGLLWVGWFGFNGGSAVAADGRAGLAMVVTHIAAASAAFSWLIVEWIARGKPTLLGLCSGAVAGLVAITPASGFVNPLSAFIIGLVAGAACYWGATSLKRLLRADDSLDVFGVHAVGGIVCALLTGVFNDPQISGLSASLGLQALGVAVVMAYSAAATALVMLVTHGIVGVRVDQQSELDGLDIRQHGERIGT
jgi:ammonium transporter, Amt family